MLWRAPRLLASAHARLHTLDPLPILRAVEQAGVPSSLTSTDDVLVSLQARTQVHGLEGLLPGFAWLAAHRLPAVGQASILHGDFHPGNVLVANGSVAGVIDWPNAGLGEPAADVATTRVLHVAQRRRAVRVGTALARETYAWSAPEQVAKMSRHFERITGVTLVLPPP